MCIRDRAEVAALPVLVATRNAQTVLNSAHAYAANPDPYVLVSAQPATRLLGQFAKLGDGAIVLALKRACGFGAKAAAPAPPPAHVDAPKKHKDKDAEAQDMCAGCCLL